MKILWITNILLPEASMLINETVNPTGGWLVNASKDLANNEEINLSIGTPKLNIDCTITVKGEKIDYYIFPWRNSKNSGSKLDRYLKKMIKDVKPDIVHVFGTEFSHSLPVIEKCNEFGIDNLISIQGLVSVCARHYMANLPLKIQKRFTLRDFLKRDSLVMQQKKFLIRGKHEIEAIKRTKHIIGRTTWDKACTSQINPSAIYHFCNESLREEFYNHSWTLSGCERYSIFSSQAFYPIKGVHYLLEAMVHIVKRFPEARLYIAGRDITKSKDLIDKVRISSYAKYIIEVINKNNIQDYVIFTGLLDEKGMCSRYLNSNVFVLPSSIENSPNSLGEAMLLGVPCVASDVGGVKDMIKHGEEGFVYQSDAPYMLAHYICELFENEDLAVNFSTKAREHAKKTHNVKENTSRLISIYKEINHRGINENGSIVNRGALKDEYSISQSKFFN